MLHDVGFKSNIYVVLIPSKKLSRNSKPKQHDKFEKWNVRLDLIGYEEVTTPKNNNAIRYSI